MEGIIFKGFLLTEEEFKQIYRSEVGQTIMTSFMSDIDTLLENFDLMDANTIFMEWTRIQNEYFFPVTILGVHVPSPSGILDGGRTDTYRFSAVASEENTLGGNTIVFKKIMEMKQFEDVENALRQHYMSLLNAINYGKFKKSEAKEFHVYLWYQVEKVQSYAKLAKTEKQKATSAKSIARATTRAKQHYTGKPYSEIYGAMPGYSREGKQLDAYMNHMGAHHPDIFNSSHAISSVAAQQVLLLNKSVAQEEGNHFLTLLLESLNTTPWFAGGDIVVVDENGQVIYNIQLKSSQRMVGRFGIRTASLKKSLLQISAAFLNGNLEQAANKMYEMLKINTANDPGPREEDYAESIASYLTQHLVK